MQTPVGADHDGNQDGLECSDCCPLSPAYTPFSSSAGRNATTANVFWNLYGLGEPLDISDSLSDDRPGLDGYGQPTAVNNTWLEWTARQLAWTDTNGYRDDDLLDYLVGDLRISRITNRTGEQPPGYVWSWSVRETWPDEDPDHDGTPSYHFDQLPRFIIAFHRAYMWTRNENFFKAVMPRARYVMEEWMKTEMSGDSGVPIVPSSNPNGTSNDGTSSGRPSTYMDQIRSGHKDGWIGAQYYTALQAMAELEEVAGNTSNADTYRNLASSYPSDYDSALWDASTGRYAGWKDVDGNLHDSGFVWTNLEAVERGLADKQQAFEIFDWLEEDAQALEVEPHKGSKDVYANVFGPRSNTSSVPDSDWDGWSDPDSGRKPYGDLVQDGGSLLWLVYHDLMARLEHIHADDANRQYMAMMNRMADEEYCLTFAPDFDRRTNDFGEDYVQIGTDEPFPESGQTVLAYLYGFIGVEAVRDGLKVSPDLPTEYASATAEVNYAGETLTITADRADTVDEHPPADPAVDLTEGDTLTQEFSPSAAVDEVAVLVGATPEASYDLEYEVDGSDGWESLGGQRITGGDRGRWIHLPVPGTTSSSDTYRIRLSDANLPSSGDYVRWHETNSPLSSATAFKNGSQLSTNFAFRVFDSRLSSVIDESSGSTLDSLSTTLGQEFTVGKTFNRTTVKLNGSSDSACTLTLYREVGGSWKEVDSERVTNLSGDVVTALGDATQPAGDYRLEISDESGDVGWYRDTSKSISGFQATDDGSNVSGVRWFTVERGTFGVSVPEKNVDTTVAPDATVTVVSQSETIDVTGTKESFGMADSEITGTPDLDDDNEGPGLANSSWDTYGQSFTVQDGVKQVEMKVANYSTPTSEFTMTLYKGEPSAGNLEEVYSARVDGFEDNVWRTFQVDQYRGGTYYIEMSNPAKKSTWWWDTDNPSDFGGDAYLDRTVESGATFAIRVEGFETAPLSALTPLKIPVGQKTGTPDLDDDSEGPGLANSSWDTYGQSFTVEDGGFHKLRAYVANYDTPSSEFTMTVYKGVPEGELSKVDSVRIDGFEDNSWVEFDIASNGGGRYYMEMSDPVGNPTWWWDTDNPRDLGGDAYLDRTVEDGAAFLIHVIG